MRSKHNKSIVPTAKMLRKKMTAEEKHLWYDFLRKYPVRFTRQKVLGKYIVDFYSAAARLAVELDGSGHYTPKGKAYDRERTEFLSGYGIEVLRIPNTDIHDRFGDVCRYIDMLVKHRMAEDVLQDLRSDGSDDG